MGAFGDPCRASGVFGLGFRCTTAPKPTVGLRDVLTGAQNNGLKFEASEALASPDKTEPKIECEGRSR